MYARVIVDIVHENVARDFTYRIPEGMSVQVGQRVEVPFGRQNKEGIVIGMADATDIPANKLKDIRSTLEDYPAVLPCLLRLAESMAETNHCPLAETLRLMLPSEMRGGRVHVKTERCARTLVPAEHLQEAILQQGRSQKRKLILTMLQDGLAHSMSELNDVVSDASAVARQLAEAGLIEIFQQEVLRRPGCSEDDPIIQQPILTASQRQVIETVQESLSLGRGRFLLHGVTGSGKTEVFIHLVRQVLNSGKSAMILVPEIALTPQMVRWFRSRFGPVAAVLHSGLSAGERFDEWRRIRRGDARVVIGARSAVFAPCEKLGLIIIDEEHENTYISDRHPRYDTRNVAAERCDNESATLLLASATPSIYSFAMARRGDYTLLEMPNRVLNRPLPQVEIVDMREELKQGNRSIFSSLLQQRLKNCINAGEQAILLMNRRGYNSFVSCRACGKAVHCPHCDIPMTYHMIGGDGLHCHYCGYTCDVPQRCPDCQSPHIRYFGAGTQKVEQELNRLFPGIGVIRMDIDTTAGKNGHEKLLEQFRNGNARILVGTQMIAKGLDFPKVTLVGVIAAEQTLNLPDYRSRQRTFQLLTQVAGRAGRGELPGRVIIQTYKPDDLTILQAASQDYRAFFEEEFARRRRGLYPPFTIMARLLAEAKTQAIANATCADLYARCNQVLEAHPEWKKRVLMMRLDIPDVAMLRGKARCHIMMKLLVHSDTDGFMAFCAGMAREDCTPDVEVYFEVNPVSMM